MTTCHLQSTCYSSLLGSKNASFAVEHPETLQSEQERDKFIEVALFGEGQQYTAKFLRKAMKHRSVNLQDETIFF